MPKVLTQVYSTCITTKFGRFLKHAETAGRKKRQYVISQDLIFLIFAIHILEQLQKFVTTVCLHVSPAILKNYHIGVLGAVFPLRIISLGQFDKI